MAYTVTIRETSKELTRKERVAFKDTTGAIRLDKATDNEQHVHIVVDSYGILDIHNDNSNDKDYVNYVIQATDGNRYVTGSESFWNAFMDIYDEMSDGDEEWGLDIYKLPSKNNTGKGFITCSIE